MALDDIQTTEITGLQFCDPEYVDYYSGLPPYHSFQQSPFQEVSDYLRYVRQFSNLPIRFTDYLAPEDAVCQDQENCDDLGHYVPSLPPIFSTHQYTLANITTFFKEALWYGYPSQPSNFTKLEFYCQMLRNANYFIVAPIFLRMLIQRDCVDAYKVIIKVFGGNDYAGDTDYRARYFILLRQQLAIWQSTHIKNYIYDRIDELSSNNFYPSEIDMLSRCTYLPNRNTAIPLKTDIINDEPFSCTNSHIHVIHCPFQAIATKPLGCSELATYRFYDFSNVVNLNINFVSPMDDFFPAKRKNNCWFKPRTGYTAYHSPENY